MTINYSFLNNVLNSKRAFYLFFIIFLCQIANAQCSNPVVGCSLTDLSNFGVGANDNAATIEYDNFVSSYHATIVRTSDGSLQVWGEKIASDGITNLLSPVTINASNFPALTTATPLKAALGSLSGSVVQGILLATDGLYAWSTEGAVLDEEITAGTTFQKITINGNATGLPAGVNPGDVKMMFATYKTLAITTCEGDVWVISQTPEVRGNGATGNATTWYRVTTSDIGNPFLTNVVACRGNYDGLMALKADGTVHVWGSNVLLGDNTPLIVSQTTAVQMTLPTAITPKMISSSGNNLLRSYYVLTTDGNLYTLGENSSRQLGDWTANDRFSWVQPRYTSTTGPVMYNIKWFSVQEHDATYGSVNVINSNKNLYAFGQNNFSLLGTTGNSANPVIPDGLTISDQILAVETGGHTSMIVKNCEGNFGYAGHRIAGSMGNGSGSNVTENAYTFATAPVQICGVESLPTIKAVSIGDGPDSKYCVTRPILLNLTPPGGTLSVLSGPATVSGNTVNFTAVGTAEIQYSVSDACGGVPTLTTLTLESADCVNNPPVAHDATVGPISAASGAIAINALNATDTDGTIVSYTIVTLPSQGVLALNGTPVTLNHVLTPAEAAAITYNPNGNFGGDDTFTFTATDNDGAVDLTPAVVTITIQKTNIIAIADQNTVIGLNQTVTVLNVLDNDTLDNNPGTLSNVDLALLTPDPTGYLTLDTDGAIQLAPNAPAGTYSLKYEICEKANPANCSNAEVTIIVTAPVMKVTVNSYCSNDAPYVSYTAFSDNTIRIGAKVLTINWIDSANNIVATQTNMPLSGSVLWPGAAIDGNNKATDWPGWIFSNGQWSEGIDGFELTRPAVTMQFILDQTTSVTVNYPRPTANCNAKPKFNINAVNENDLILADGINGSIAIVNVLHNDQLNGIQPNASNVVVAGVNLPAGITLNGDGTIDVAPGTKGGPYTVTYQICEANDLTNCSTATLNIFVQVPALTLLKTVQFNDSNGNGYAEVGETLSYHFSITNNGNTDLENIIIEDPLPGIVMSGGPINLAVGQTDDYSFTASYTLTQTDLIAGNVSNQATTSGISKTGIIVFDKSDPENRNTDNPTIIELSGCVIEIFNAVSADGDDMNKRFYIKNLECYPDNSVQIFNRWGVLVFEREHYNNNDIAFRGISEGRVTVKDSKGLPEGTYYYILRYKDRQSNPHQEAGYLYLTK
ncbi:T9SS type B sorting domain-containing protein [Flavobacterium hercynium]|uniref:DUF7507 domain-containing protein n=1 Tax=Flavobacterium hercynium TaxID=387094 RepID=A0A226GRS4_9FLAO|nr:gliding motility-associated C-terminal domain-containing protein [Flavobacterium hercynium]OXA84096.1 hypothetical protein B0A66_21365 [Flavobacterium hercynium]SMP20921.1 conserved repeat domain-containing protein [Flavobacterium hercynium]